MNRLAFPVLLLPFEALAHAAEAHHTHVNAEILLLAVLVAALAILRSR
jgi:hypothetical protein